METVKEPVCPSVAEHEREGWTVHSVLILQIPAWLPLEITGGRQVGPEYVELTEMLLLFLHGIPWGEGGGRC